MSIRSAMARAIETTPYSVLFGKDMAIPTAVIYDIAWEKYVEPTPKEWKELLE